MLSFLRRRFATRRSRVLLGGFVVFVPVFTYVSVEATSVPGFCNSCHVIKPAYESWKRSPHRTVKGKERADCRDCHVPSWKEPWSVVGVKLYHGVKDTYNNLAGNARPDDPTYYFELKHDALQTVDNEICLNCHEDILTPEKDVIKTEEGEVRGLHRSEEAAKLACTVCHKNTGHDLYQ